MYIISIISYWGTTDSSYDYIPVDLCGRTCTADKAAVFRNKSRAVCYADTLTKKTGRHFSICNVDKSVWRKIVADKATRI